MGSGIEEYQVGFSLVDGGKQARRITWFGHFSLPRGAEYKLQYGSTVVVLIYLEDAMFSFQSTLYITYYTIPYSS